MQCLLTWGELTAGDGPLWKALTVPPGHYRITLGPVEVFSTVHRLKLILAIDSLLRGAGYLLSRDFKGMELEDEPDYTTLISSCRAVNGFFILSLGLP